jgi:Holliday junction resolvasome RuvABC endonuclease subunit
VRGLQRGQVKKQFAGSGKASKDDMIKQCRALGFNVKSDNEADAIAVLHVATGRCPLLTMSGATPKNAAKRPPTIPAGA